MRESKVKEFEEARERDPERIIYVRIEQCCRRRSLPFICIRAAPDTEVKLLRRW